MPGEDAENRWYVRSRGRVKGPLSLEQLRGLRDRGQLARFDQVSSDRETWVAADTLESLFPNVGSGGAFVTRAGGGAKQPSRKRDPAPDSSGFLVIDDDDRPHVDHDSRPVDPYEGISSEPIGWFYADAGSPQGPVGFDELSRLARDGRIGPTTLYWRAGLEQWTSGADLHELNRLWPFASDLGVPTIASDATSGQSARTGGTARRKMLTILGIATGVIILVVVVVMLFRVFFAKAGP